MEHLPSQVLFDNVLVNATGSVEGPILDFRVGPSITPYAIAMKASSVSGTADVKLDFHTSEDGTNFDHYDDRPDIVSSSLSERTNGPELWNEYPFTDVMNKFIQMQVTGVNSNPADTRVSAKILFREVI